VQVNQTVTYSVCQCQDNRMHCTTFSRNSRWNAQGNCASRISGLQSTISVCRA